MKIIFYFCWVSKKAVIPGWAIDHIAVNNTLLSKSSYPKLDW